MSHVEPNSCCCDIPQLTLAGVLGITWEVAPWGPQAAPPLGQQIYELVTAGKGTRPEDATVFISAAATGLGNADAGGICVVPASPAAMPFPEFKRRVEQAAAVLSGACYGECPAWAK